MYNKTTAKTRFPSSASDFALKLTFTSGDGFLVVAVIPIGPIQESLEYVIFK